MTSYCMSHTIILNLLIFFWILVSSLVSNDGSVKMICDSVDSAFEDGSIFFWEEEISGSLHVSSTDGKFEHCSIVVWDRPPVESRGWNEHWLVVSKYGFMFGRGVDANDKLSSCSWYGKYSSSSSKKVCYR